MDKIKDDRMGLHTRLFDKINELVEGHNENRRRYDEIMTNIARIMERIKENRKKVI